MTLLEPSGRLQLWPVHGESGEVMVVPMIPLKLGVGR